MKKAVSIRDIAEMSNVSVSTVSRILNNTGRHSKETEKKVRAAIALRKYHPSILAKGLRTNTTHSIGILVPDITNEFFSSITLSIQNTLFERSFMTLICNTNEQPSIQTKQLEMLRSNRVSGIIFISGENITEEDLSDGIPKVFVDRLPWNAKSQDIISIEVDNFMGGLLATEELLQSGCKRIVTLFEGRGLSTQVARYSGYLQAYQNRGLQVVHELYQPVKQISLSEGYEVTKRLIKSGVSFDGIFCYCDLLACGAMHALAEAGISVPGEVKIMGYDNVSPSRFYKPSISTIEQPVQKMGSLAAELILQLQYKKESVKSHHLLPVNLIRRETTCGSKMTEVQNG
jgi:LacI family transcriptional regulator